MKFLTKIPVRAALVLPLVLWLLRGCAVYEHVFHPYRLPTPKMSAADKAKVRAAEKARHKGTSLKAAEVSTDKTDAAAGGEPGAPSVGAPTEEKRKTMSYSELPTGTKLTYDKEGLLKRTIFERKEAKRRKLHHYDTRPLTPREASRENRKLRKKGHTDNGKGKAAPREQAPPNPALDLGPDPGPPASAPAAPAEALPTKRPAKAKKEALPQPDPTQPAPAPAPKPAKQKKAGKSKVPVPKPDPTQPLPDTGQ